jgi:hypothetical protein
MNRVASERFCALVLLFLTGRSHRPEAEGDLPI